jgi:hypothetical protein
MQNALFNTIGWLLTTVVSLANLQAHSCDNFTDGGLVGGTNDTVTTSYCNLIGSMPGIFNVQTPSGGSGGEVLYQWQISANQTTWTDINLQEGRNEFLLPSGMLAYLSSLGYTPMQTMRFRRGARRSTCDDFVYSNIREFKVMQQVSTPGLFTESHVVCINSAAPDCVQATDLAWPGMPGSYLATGGSQPLEYLWEQSHDGLVWTNYSTEALPTICPPLGTRTYYRRGVRPANSPCGYRHSNVISIFHVLPVQMDIITINPTCDNQNNGSITLSDIGGNDSTIVSNFRFSIDNGANWQTSNTFSNLGIGTYTIIIREHETKCAGCYLSSAVCSLSATLTATPSPIIDSVAAPSPGACNLPERSINIWASGGVPPLLYSIDGVNFQESSYFSNLENGVYLPIVKNNVGICSDSAAAIVINNPLQIEIDSVSFINPQSCGSSDGTIEVHYAQGGIPPIQYSTNGISYQTSPVFSNLQAGEYRIWVKNGDGSCAFLLDTIDLQDLTPPLIDSVLIEHTSDCGILDGSLQIFASGILPFLYSIDGGQNWISSNFFQNLASGTYVIAVQYDAVGCIQTDTVDIDSPISPSIDDVISTNTTNCNATDGTITILLHSPGTEYLYSINGSSGPWQSSPVFSGLSAGNYEVWVSNGDGSCPVVWPSLIAIEQQT